MLLRRSVRPRKPTRRTPQVGSIAVESALILPLLLASVAATMVLGVRLSDYMYLSQSVRELGIVLGRVPYMAALRAPGGDAAYEISLAPSGDQTTVAAAAATYLTTLSAGACGPASSNYSACTTAARGVTSWYAQQILLMKRLMVAESLTLNVQFGPPGVDIPAADGLCMLHITVTAQSRAWLSWAVGQMVVSQSLPYVSLPVPNADSGCCPSGAC
jgi:hypothetical protein